MNDSCLALMLASIAGCASAAPHTPEGLGLTKVGDTVVDDQALTIQGEFGPAINGKSFQQDIAVTHGGFQYVGYYDGARRVCLGRRALPRGEWQVVRFEDYDFRSNDAHNTISIGICPNDGTIHLAFDHHGHPLHYRVSRKGVASDPAAFAWDAALFGPITSELEPGKPIAITYPRFWQTPGGGLQFCYRRGSSGNGDRMLVDYDDDEGVWIETRQIDSGEGVFEDELGRSDSRCSYPNGYGYGPHGRLHATWVWREHSQGSNHDLVYVYSEDQGRTWKNDAGSLLDAPPGVESPGLVVVDIPRTLGLMNTHGQAVDSQGRVHVVMWHCSPESLAAAGSEPGASRWGPPEARRYHHYWRDERGEWKHRELPWVAGIRPKLFIDRHDDVFLLFRSRDQFVRKGALVIAAASAASGWTDWRVIHREEGPFVGEMLGDPYRWKESEVLSVVAQEAPGAPHEATALRVLDFLPIDRTR